MMIKRVLISFLSVLLILISATGFFSYYIDICDSYIFAANSSEGITVDYMFNVDLNDSAKSDSSKSADSSSRYVALVGKDKKAGKYFCAVYSAEGKLIYRELFGADKETCVIHDIRVTSNKINILFSDDAVPMLYSDEISAVAGGEAAHKSELLSFPEFKEGEILKLLLPDSNAEYIAVATKEKTTLFSRDAQIVREYPYSSKNVITSGVYHNDVLLLCGAASASEDGEGFSHGQVEAFDNTGKSIWSRDVYREDNCVSSVMECQINNDGNLLLYGRFYDYSKSDLVMTTLDVQTVEDFKTYGHGISYHIYTADGEKNEEGFARPSVFIAELDMAGNEKNVNVYSVLNDYRVPSISQEKSLNKLNAEGEFILTSAQATGLSADSYFLTIDKVKIEIPCNIHVIYDVDNTGGIFAYLAESSAEGYNIKYFKSAAEFSKGMEELRKALRVSRLLDYAPTVMPWGLVCVVAIILLIAKHKWRNIDSE